MTGALTYNTFIQLVAWYSVIVPKNILKTWRGYLKFGLYYFSVGSLLKTLFSPWHRYQWAYDKRGFDIERFLETLFSNVISRTIGFLARICLIVVGICAELLIFFAGLSAVGFWYILPVLLIFGIYHGIRLSI